MNENDSRSPEEIESDIERTRADFSSTIEAIQHKLSPSEMMDNAVDYALSTTPGAFSVNLINSVRDNPIPVALIGVGIAWLMAAGRKEPAYPAGYYRRGRRSAYYSDLDTPYEDEFAAEYPTSADAGTSSDGMMQRMASRTGDTARGLKEKASQAGQRLSSSASSVTGRVQQAGQSARSRLQETTQSARSRLQETTQSAQARMSEMSRRSQMHYSRAKQQVGQFADEQPLMIGAIGIAVGAALGALLPRTRREDELLGDTRDELLERAKEAAREQAETVKQSAQRVAEMAKQEATRMKDDMASTASQSMGQGQGQAQGGASRTEGASFGGTGGQQSIH
ncbi:MAG TPA: DUF3618 domain-containing protein [Noviherbaspirillum sp.]|jgi:ElaB/YqjD/DUF883 family membrane-anchored ribosome-binding protein|uniref:DUF3618 domain-containing protein n=1 Tax=Noviherbaspirillum sp. TaxID=1926288 RepID=UPI002F94FC31